MTRGALKRRYVGPNEWLDEWLERLGEPWAHCAIRDSGAAALQSCLIGSQSAAKFEALSGYLHIWGRGRGRSPREENLSDFRVKTAISSYYTEVQPYSSYSSCDSEQHAPIDVWVSREM